jgi:hypothetical protein
MPATAFTARFRLMENARRKDDRSPEQNLVIDFTPEDAMAAASYLMTMAENAEANGTTIRVYNGKNDYSEVTGFSLWGGMWGNSGKISPLQPEAIAAAVPF